MSYPKSKYICRGKKNETHTKLYSWRSAAGPLKNKVGRNERPTEGYITYPPDKLIYNDRNQYVQNPRKILVNIYINNMVKL